MPLELTAEIDTTTWAPPAIFRRIAREGSILPGEMYRVFNMGIGLVGIVPAERVGRQSKARRRRSSLGRSFRAAMTPGALAGARDMRAEVRMGGDSEAMRGPRLAEGKTKVVYADPTDPALAVIVHKDDITAGDGARRDRLPGKGALSGRTTSNVFRLLRASGIPTHLSMPPPRTRWWSAAAT